MRLGVSEQTNKNKTKFWEGKCVENDPKGVLRKKYEYAFKLPTMHFWEKIKTLSYGVVFNSFQNSSLFLSFLAENPQKLVV